MLMIESLTRAKLAELDSTIKLALSGKRDVAASIVKTPHSDSLMTAIRSGLRSMTDEEANVLRSRQRALVLELRNGDYIAAALATALAVMMIALLVIAPGAQHYRNLVTLCAWARSVEYDG